MQRVSLKNIQILKSNHFQLINFLFGWHSFCLKDKFLKLSSENGLETTAKFDYMEL